MLKIYPFRTVEPLAARPRVLLLQPGLSASSVKATRLSNGSYRATFLVRAGRAGSAEIQIRGRDAGGQVNRMSVPVRVGG